jgi:hypothetical protein
MYTQVKKKKKREKVEGKHLNGENVDEETRIRRENKKKKQPPNFGQSSCCLRRSRFRVAFADSTV